MALDATLQACIGRKDALFTYVRHDKSEVCLEIIRVDDQTGISSAWWHNPEAVSMFFRMQCRVRWGPQSCNISIEVNFAHLKWISEPKPSGTRRVCKVLSWQKGRGKGCCPCARARMASEVSAGACAHSAVLSPLHSTPPLHDSPPRPPRVTIVQRWRTHSGNSGTWQPTCLAARHVPEFPECVLHVATSWRRHLQRTASASPGQEERPAPAA